MNKEPENAARDIGAHLVNDKKEKSADRVPTALGVVGGAASAAATGASVAVGAVAAVVTAPIALSAAAVVGLGYGIKKLSDWLDD